MKDGHVAQFAPEAGETVRAVKLLASRAAASKNLKVQIWEHENKVYLKKASD